MFCGLSSPSKQVDQSNAPTTQPAVTKPLEVEAVSGNVNVYDSNYASIPSGFNIPVIPANAKIIVLKRGEAPPAGAVEIPAAPIEFSPVVAKQYNASAHLTYGDVHRIINGSPTHPCDVALNSYLGAINFEYCVEKCIASECDYVFGKRVYATIFLDKSGSLCALFGEAPPRIVSVHEVMQFILAKLKEAEAEQASAEHAALMLQQQQEATLLQEKQEEKAAPVVAAIAKKVVASPSKTASKETAKEPASPKAKAKAKASSAASPKAASPSKTPAAAGKTAKAPAASPKKAAASPKKK